MYFWKIKNLKKDLIQNPLSEKEQFKYLLATNILSFLAIIPLRGNNTWYVYSRIVLFIILVLGTYYIYKMNGSSNGKYFLQRFLSLGWIISVRLSVIVFLASIVISLIVFSIDISQYLSIYHFVVPILISLIYFWLLGKHIKEVSLKSQNKQ